MCVCGWVCVSEAKREWQAKHKVTKKKLLNRRRRGRISENNKKNLWENEKKSLRSLKFEVTEKKEREKQITDGRGRRGREGEGNREKT